MIAVLFSTNHYLFSGIEVSRTPKGLPEQLAIALTYRCKLFLFKNKILYIFFLVRGAGQRRLAPPHPHPHPLHPSLRSALRRGQRVGRHSSKRGAGWVAPPLPQGREAGRAAASLKRVAGAPPPCPCPPQPCGAI